MTTTLPLEDSKRVGDNEHTMVATAPRQSPPPVELFAVSLYDTRDLQSNSNNVSDEPDRYTPPPPFPHSRPVTAVSRQLPLPGSVADDSNDGANPPPNYVECSFPPPTYDDLYENAEKSQKGFPKRKIKQIIFYLCLGGLSIALLTIGIWSAIFQTCEMVFLVVWNLVTGCLLIICIFTGICKTFRKLISRRANLAQTLIYCSAIFTACWLVTGLVTSFGETGGDSCSQEVTDMIIAASIIICAFSVFACLCGNDLFNGTRTHPT